MLVEDEYSIKSAYLSIPKSRLCVIFSQLCRPGISIKMSVTKYNHMVEIWNSREQNLIKLEYQHVFLLCCIYFSELHINNQHQINDKALLSKHLIEIGSVRPSVRPSVLPSVRAFSWDWYHQFFLNFGMVLETL